MKASAIILCGGKGRRFGGDKTLVTVGNKPVIERVIERLSDISDQILLVTSEERAALPPPPQAETIVDDYPGKGPLGGIYTGLVRARHPRSLVVGCDMPFLNSDLLRHMLRVSSTFDAVVPRLDAAMVEPLHAVYSAACVPIMKNSLERGDLAINRLLGALHIRYLEKQEWLKLDPSALSFYNINYPQDLARANEIAAEIDGTTKPA